jgi:transcriptional regulator with XRE-family HTH domain
MDRIGNRIKRLREMKNYTQEYMANNLNISQNSYSRIENETVKLTTDRLQKISEILEVPVEYLVNLDAPIYNFHNENASIKFSGHFENITDGQGDTLKLALEILEKQIIHLTTENKRLTDIIERMTKSK